MSGLMQRVYPFGGAGESLKQAVWAKGREISGHSPAIWRRDVYGGLMKYSDHGNRNSTYGWEIDHIKPTSKGGSDSLYNLQPLTWSNNAAKGDQYP